MTMPPYAPVHVLGLDRVAQRDAGLAILVDRLVPDPMGHGAHLFVLVEAR